MIRHESTQAEEDAVGLKFFYRRGESSSSPLVVLIHGRAGNRGVMWTFERGIPHECHVVSFEAFLPDPLGGWSWWDMTAPGSKKEAITYAAKKCAVALEAFVKLYSLTPSTIVALGFSQGSVLASAAAFLGFAPFDAVGVLAGFVFLPEGSDVTYKTSSVFVAHGTNDETIPVEKARVGVKALRDLGLDVVYVEEEVGHKVGIQGTRALKEWLHLRVSE